MIMTTNSEIHIILATKRNKVKRSTLNCRYALCWQLKIIKKGGIRKMDNRKRKFDKTEKIRRLWWGRVGAEAGEKAT